MAPLWSTCRPAAIRSAGDEAWSFSPPTTKARRLHLKGKSLRWSFRANYLSLRIGVSHLTSVGRIWDVQARRKGKTTIIMWSTSQDRLGFWAQSASLPKRPNIYHGRGIRASRSPLARKDGKVSAYR
jgi:ribosomal protein L6P/L9E